MTFRRKVELRKNSVIAEEHYFRLPISKTKKKTFLMDNFMIRDLLARHLSTELNKERNNKPNIIF